MSTKIIYFSVSGRDEKAEFRSDDKQEEILELFRAAAEAGPKDVLKLYNTNGHIMCVSPKLDPNTPDTKYRLEVVGTHYHGVAPSVSSEVTQLELRISQLESRLTQAEDDLPDYVKELQRRVQYLTEKLESVNHLSWLGFHKDLSENTALKPFWPTGDIQGPPEQRRKVLDKFQQLSHVQFSNSVLESLKHSTFDNWQWDEAEMMMLIKAMFTTLQLPTKFNIANVTLDNFLKAVYRSYNNVPFHNFNHCFMVTQMMYSLIHAIKLYDLTDDLDILMLLLSTMCHDLNHPGLNNSYQINAQTELSLRYNDASPLENHHCSIAFHMLQNPECNILKTLTVEQFQSVRAGMIRCILATDMVKHNEILSKFKGLISTFDISKKDHKELLYMIMIKVADVSNEARPVAVSEPWLEHLLAEYFAQGDLEKVEGLPVAPFMDRDKVTKPSAQIGFIKFVLLPLFGALGDLFPTVNEVVVEPVKNNLNYYQNMQIELDEQKRKEEEEKTNRLQQGNSKNGVHHKH